MACYHPLTAFARTPPGSTKKELTFNFGGDPPYVFVDGHLYSEKLKIPCGQCDGCRMDYARQWAIRCALEAKQWVHNYFVTLTYNDEFVPIVPHEWVELDTGEYHCDDVMTLVPDHLRDFMKRLRRNFEREKGFDGVRFYACGEYGPKNMRPHYHLILFNCPLDDLELIGRRDGYVYYRSSFVEKAWSERLHFDGKSVRWPMGFVQICDFTYETAAYVARYMLKKHKGLDADFYEKAGIAPEFTRCSRRPGIAARYYEENRDMIYEFDQVNVLGGKGQVLKAHPPKYFDRLFDVDNPEQLCMIKEKRKDTAIRSMQEQLKKTDLSEPEYLVVKEANFRSRIKKLKRSL